VTAPSPLDALLPPEMARRAEEAGAAKATTDRGRLVALAVLAGAFIAFGGIFSTVALAGAYTWCRSAVNRCFLSRSAA
jgi:formate transporter